MAFETILLTHENGVATLTLNRPAAMNALCRQLNEELLLAFEQLRTGSTRVLIVTGGEKAFAAGADISEMADADPAAAAATCEIGHKVHDTLEALPFAKAFSTHDQKEGMRAFIEKRKPQYTNN